MASVICQMQRQLLSSVKQLMIIRGLATSHCACKNIRSGIVKATVRGDKPLTYEQALAPYQIGVRKSWNSWNTSNLKGEGRKAETVVEDMFIRKFIMGTFHRLFCSEVIIKRRHNMIIIAGLVLQNTMPRKLYFLWGYSEELLSHYLKCPVKLEIQTVADRRDITFKYV
ncbi:28S ribosomal protein S24, mitochondrial-like [Gigantopelta aegis]|uniref:28S ribosomal protein S24, mitochondrial-like n=1 Tax=Gigantopelta aegis TaxID=1735272 RepID=UPI001B88DDB2|nr:28S ribosomal protein S24, mitochondrial-like [Gigantopelta aegis]